METMLQLQLTGQINGEDARVTISIDSEDALDISSVGVEDVEGQTSDQSQQAATDGEGGTVTPESSVSTETTDEPASADDAAEGADSEFDAEDLPPMTAGTKQYAVARAVMQSEAEWVPARDILETIQETDDDRKWNRSIVTSHIHSLQKKGVLDREKDASLGVYQYRMTDVGEETLRRAADEADE